MTAFWSDLPVPSPGTLSNHDISIIFFWGANEYEYVAVTPTPSEIFNRAVTEGERRLDQSLLELMTMSSIAGVGLIVGIVALGMVYASVKPVGDAIAVIAGALAFGIGLVFVIIGRAELFAENLFDPIATAVEQSDSWLVAPLLRLWIITFMFNLIGGGLFALLFAVNGVLPPEAVEALMTVAEESTYRKASVAFVNALLGGALIVLLSYLLEAVNSDWSRITISYLVGVLFALGPFNHVVITLLYLFFGILFGANITLHTLVATAAVSTVGNLVGGLGLVTLSYATQ